MWRLAAGSVAKGRQWRQRACVCLGRPQAPACWRQRVKWWQHTVLLCSGEAQKSLQQAAGLAGK